MNKGKNLNDENEEKEKFDVEGEDTEEEGDEDEESDAEDDISALKELLIDVEVNMKSNEKNRLDEQYVLR